MSTKYFWCEGVELNMDTACSGPPIIVYYYLCITSSYEANVHKEDTYANNSYSDNDNDNDVYSWSPVETKEPGGQHAIIQ